MLDQHDGIRLEVADFLRFFDFNEMDMCFLLQFVVPRGFIFTHDELAKILCHSYSKDIKVTVTNVYRDKATGNLMPDQTVIDAVNALTSFSTISFVCHGFWKEKCEISTTPTIKQPHSVVESDYLLAELIPEKNFIVTANCNIEVE
uniref:Uncharacterized protein n=1 Tax=Panagrolaimus sp. PS1159 TaxID=55785 RepID=A0AC35G1N6_9BILA